MAEGRGVLYVATGAAHTEAARRSAASVRATNPGLGVALFTDRAVTGPEFDRVEPVASPHVRSKVDYLPETPFAETLYLDTDTRVLGDLGEMFRLLERFEMALAQRVHVPASPAKAVWRHAVPSSFPQLNGGVLLYRSSPAALGFLGDWRAAYAEAGFGVDQITLRELALGERHPLRGAAAAVQHPAPYLAAPLVLPARRGRSSCTPTATIRRSSARCGRGWTG